MKSFPRWLFAAWLSAVSLLVALGVWFYIAQRRHVRNEVVANLQVISQLKADQISAWRRGRLDEAAEFMDKENLAERIVEWMETRAPEAAKGIPGQFRRLQVHDRYEDVLLVDTDGRVVFSLAGATGKVQEEVMGSLSEAFEDGQPTLTDLHVDPNDLRPHIDTVTPLFARVGDATEPVAAVVFVNSASQFLFPLIQSWPIASRTAETLIVRKDGDSVLYLNELRHRSDTALKLRVPLARRDLIAVKAVLGQEGVIQGNDYRGVEALSVAAPIPDSPWILVAKVDMEEAFGVWRFLSVLLFGVLLSSIGIAATVAGIAWQRHKKRHYRTLYRAEAAQRENLERYHRALDGMMEGCRIIGEDWRYLYVNEAAAKQSGRSREELMGRTMMEVFPGIENTELFSILRECMDHRIARQAEVDFAYPEGETFWFDLRIQPVPEGLFILSIDITERKRIEEALRESEKKFWGAFNTSSLALAIATLEGELVEVNQGFCELSGFSRQEALGKTAVDLGLLTGPEREALVGTIESAGGALRNLEVKFHVRDGRVRSVLYSLEPIDLSGVAHRLATVVDITDRQRAEEALRESEERYRSILENMEEGYYEVDIAGNLTFFNESTTRIFGYPREKLLGMNNREYTSPETAKEMYRIFNQVYRTGESASASDYEVIRADGSKRTLEMSSALQRDNTGRPIGFCGVIRDITSHLEIREEKAQLESRYLQSQKMEAVGRLAGGVAHDFNNMLQTILGYSDLALHSVSSDSPLHQNLDEIRRAAERSANLTRQLLAFARKQTAIPKVLDLNDAVESLLKMLRRLIGEDIDLTWRPAFKIGKVKIDPTQVDQILANLVVNARDAIEGVGKVTIETSGVTLDEAYCVDHAGFVPGEYVLLTVSDDGCGMDRETQERIFEPFFTTKALGEGTGLGLSTVWGIVKQNNAFINVYSEPGEGSAFRIYFPQWETELEVAVIERIKTPPPRGAETILLVEDEGAVLLLGKRILEDLGYTVLTAGKPGEAIRLVEGNGSTIHLLISDVVMPEMNGRELSQRIVALHPDIRVLFMSGYTADAIAHHGVLEEGIRFIQKPFTMEALATKVREALDYYSGGD